MAKSTGCSRSAAKSACLLLVYSSAVCTVRHLCHLSPNDVIARLMVPPPQPAEQYGADVLEDRL